MRKLFVICLSLLISSTILFAADISHTPLVGNLLSTDKLPLGRPTENKPDGKGTAYTTSIDQLSTYISNSIRTYIPDYTNANNITSGTLNHSRLPLLLSGDIPQLPQTKITGLPEFNNLFVNYTSTHKTNFDVTSNQTISGFKNFSGAGIKTSDIISKGPVVDVRSFMDGKDGRPSLSDWKSNPNTTVVTLAVQAALNSSKNIYFPNGTYLVDGLTIHSDTHIWGEGKNSLLKKPSISGIPMLTNYRYDVAGSYSADGNIIIENLAFDDLANIDTVDPTGDCIGIGHAENIVIKGCHFINHKLHAIDLTGVKNARIYGNILYSGKSGGIQIDAAATGGIYGIYADNTPSYEIEVFNNTIYSSCYDPDSGAGGYTGGIHVHRTGHSHLSIHHNYIQGPNQGIFLDPNCNYSYVVISDNQIYGKTLSGTSTKVYSNHHFGIRGLCNLSYSRISNNTISGWDDGGIKVTYNASPLSYTAYLSITGNTVTDTAGKLIDITNNDDLTVNDNKLILDRTEASIGISLDGISRFQCQENQILGTGQTGNQTGIYIDNGALLTLSGVVSRNHLSSLQTTINVNTGSDINIESNKIKNCGTPYLVIGGSATGISHRGNINYDSGWVALNAGTEVVLSHNLTIAPTNIQVLVSMDSSGSAPRLPVTSSSGVGVFITSIGTITLSVRGGANGVVGGFNDVGVWGVAATNGYVRILSSI
jgi:hypothetical protein